MPSDDKSTLVQVMAWCRQATSHYLNQCWPSSLSLYGVARPKSQRNHLKNGHSWTEMNYSDLRKWEGIRVVDSGIWGAVCFRSSSERAVTDVRDGPLGWTFETNGTDSWRRLLQKSVRAGRGSRPWTAGRDGPPERTFETNGTDSCRRLLQKFVRAGRGRPAVTGRRDWLLKQTARIPGADCCRSPSERAVGAGRGRPAVTGRRNGLLKQTARIPVADCCRSSSERAVDGRPWRAAGIDFWNKRHAFLAPIVAEVRQSGPWTAGRDGPPGLTFETNGTHSWRRLLQKFVRAGRGRPAVTGRRDWLLKQTARIPGADCCRSPSERAVGAGRGRPAVTGRRGLTFETNGTDSCRRLLQKFVRAGRGRPAVTGRWDGLLKQTARIPGADCCRSSSERAVDGRPWRAAGIDFWNKRHAFLAPIVAEVRQSGPWTAGRDGPPGLTFETNGTDSWRRLLQKSVRAGRGSRPWTAGRDGPPGIDFWNKRHGFLSPIVAEVRQSGPWTAGRDGPPGIDFWNKRHGFLAPIVSKVCQIGPWWRAVDGWPWRAFISPTLTIPERRHSNTTCT